MWSTWTGTCRAWHAGVCISVLYGLSFAVPLRKGKNASCIRAYTRMMRTDEPVSSLFPARYTSATSRYWHARRQWSLPKRMYRASSCSNPRWMISQVLRWQYPLHSSCFSWKAGDSCNRQPDRSRCFRLSLCRFSFYTVPAVPWRFIRVWHSSEKPT